MTDCCLVTVWADWISESRGNSIQSPRGKGVLSGRGKNSRPAVHNVVVHIVHDNQLNLTSAPLFSPVTRSPWLPEALVNRGKTSSPTGVPSVSWRHITCAGTWPRQLTNHRRAGQVSGYLAGSRDGRCCSTTVWHAVVIPWFLSTRGRVYGRFAWHPYGTAGGVELRFIRGITLQEITFRGIIISGEPAPSY